MKELKLKALALGTEVLSRAEMKSLLGGTVDPGGGCSDECTEGTRCSNNVMCARVNCIEPGSTKTHTIC